MIARSPLLAVFVAVLSLSAGSAFAQDARNPLLNPKAAVSKAADVAPGHPATPSLDTKLPSPGASLMAAGSMAMSPVASNISSQLSGLHVIAVIGDKAVLRGTMGKGSSFVIAGSTAAGEGAAPTPGGAAPAPATDSPAGVSAAAVTLVLRHSQPFQMAEGVWVRPDVSGVTVRLFQQSTKKLDKDASSETLVYAASLETLSPTAPLSEDKGNDKGEGQATEQK